MKSLLYTLSRIVLVALAATAVACDAESPTEPSPTGLTGTWRATRAEYASKANPNQRVEVVAQGTTLVLALESAGTFTLTSTDPGATPDVRTGTWTASTDVLTLKPAGMSWDIQFGMTLSGNTLTLEGGSAFYDVNGDDIDDEATLSMTLTRQ